RESVLATVAGVLEDSGSRIEIDCSRDNARDVDIALIVQSDVVRFIIAVSSHAPDPDELARAIKFCHEYVARSDAGQVDNSRSGIKIARLFKQSGTIQIACFVEPGPPPSIVACGSECEGQSAPASRITGVPSNLACRRVDGHPRRCGS